MMMNDVWVVVPMFNEEAAIGSVVHDLRSVFPRVVCVDDGSLDQTAAVARGAGATVLRHSVNLGQGAALQTGFEFVGGQPGARWVVTFDADGQHLVSDAARMVGIAREQHLDVVLASRFAGEVENMPRLRHAVLRAAVAYTRWSSRLAVTDTHNGLRVISTRVLNQLSLRQSRMAHASELLNRIHTHKLSYVEVPTTVVYSEYSLRKTQTNLNSINILFDLALARLRAGS